VPTSCFSNSKGKGSSHFINRELSEKDRKRMAHTLIACGNNGSYMHVLMPRYVSISQELLQQFSFSWHLMAWPRRSISGQQ
jgi:hypothetical protein